MIPQEVERAEASESRLMLLITEHDDLLPSARAAHARMAAAQARLAAITDRTEATIDVFMVNKATVAREDESMRRCAQRATTIADASAYAADSA